MWASAAAAVVVLVANLAESDILSIYCGILLLLFPENQFESKLYG